MNIPDGQRSGENARGHKPAGKNKRHVSGSGSAPKRKPNTNKPNSGNKGSDSNPAVAGDDKSVRNNGSNYKRGNLCWRRWEEQFSTKRARVLQEIRLWW